ncbi:MAG: biopolymer transporter ExbD [Spirochaetaceae bacterium]|nr:MAG: biopolymer transporter ExbD [Spirochaetaceae bacterium]
MKLEHEEILDNDSWQSSTSDIAFLLVVFFILTAGAVAVKIIPLGLLPAGSDIVLNEAPVELVINNAGILSMDGKPVQFAELPELLDGQGFYRITVHDSRSYQEFIDLLGALKQAGIGQIDLVTEGAE